MKIKDRIIRKENIYAAIYAMESYIGEIDLLNSFQSISIDTLKEDISNKNIDDSIRKKLAFLLIHESSDIVLYQLLKDKYDIKFIDYIITNHCQNKLNHIIDNPNAFFSSTIFFKPKKVADKKVEYRPLHASDLISQICMISILLPIIYEDKYEGNKRLFTNIGNIFPSNFYGNLPSEEVTHIFKPWNKQYQKYSDAIISSHKTFSENKEYKTEISLDLKNFFPSVDPRILIKYIVDHLSIERARAKAKEDYISVLTKILYVKIKNNKCKDLEEYYGETSENRENWSIGIPQGLPTSYFFGNIGMLIIKNDIEKEFPGKSYYYVDDSVIFSKERLLKDVEFNKKISRINTNISKRVNRLLIDFKDDFNFNFKTNLKHKIEIHNWNGDDSKSKNNEIKTKNSLYEISKVAYGLNFELSTAKDYNDDKTILQKIDVILKKINHDLNDDSNTSSSRQIAQLNRYKKFFSNRKNIILNRTDDLNKIRLESEDLNTDLLYNTNSKITKEEFCEEVKNGFIIPVVKIHLQNPSKREQIINVIKEIEHNLCSEVSSHYLSNVFNGYAKIIEISPDLPKPFLHKIIDETIINLGRTINKEDRYFKINNVFQIFNQILKSGKRKPKTILQLIIEKEISKIKDISDEKKQQITDIIEQSVEQQLHNAKHISSSNKNIEIIQNNIENIDPNLNKILSTKGLKKILDLISVKTKDIQIETRYTEFEDQLHNIINTFSSNILTTNTFRSSSKFQHQILYNLLCKLIDVPYNIFQKQSTNRELTYLELRILLYSKNMTFFNFNNTFLFWNKIFDSNKTLDTVDPLLNKALPFFFKYIGEPKQIDDLILTHRYVNHMWKNGSKFLYFYTLHNEEHAIELIDKSCKIYKYIDHLSLKRKDFHLLFAACYLHDISMVNYPNISSFNNNETKAITTRWLELTQKDTLSIEDANELMIKAYEMVNEYFEESIRKNHACSSSHIIVESHDLNFFSEFEKQTIAKISEAHGYDVNDIYQIKSFARTEIINEKYAKIILRLADNLDMSRQRVAETFLRKNINNMPATSKYHWVSHLAIENCKIYSEYSSQEKENTIQLKEKLIFDIDINNDETTIIPEVKGEDCKLSCEYNPSMTMNIIFKDKDTKGCENCNLACKWFTDKQYWLIKELEALNRYLRRVPQKVFNTDIEINLKLRNTKTISRDFMDVVHNKFIHSEEE